MNASNTPTAACWASGDIGQRAQQHAAAGISSNSSKPGSARSSDARRNARARRGASAIAGDEQRQPGTETRRSAAHARVRPSCHMSTMNRLAPAPPRLRDRRREARRDTRGERRVRVGEGAAQDHAEVRDREQQVAAALRERAWHAPGVPSARTTLWKASEATTPWAVDSRSGRTATRSGFSRRTAPVISSATYAETRRSSRLPARRSANVSLSNRPRRTISKAALAAISDDPDHRQRPRDRRAGPTVPRSRRSAAPSPSAPSSSRDLTLRS